MTITMMKYLRLKSRLKELTSKPNMEDNERDEAYQIMKYLSEYECCKPK